MESFIPVFNQRYQNISEGNEKICLNYESDLHKSKHNNLLKDSIEKDKILRHTSTGIHKDDMLFTINEFSIKKFQYVDKCILFVVLSRARLFRYGQKLANVMFTNSLYYNYLY